MPSPNEFTILVVDDEPDVRTYFETALTDAGFNVATASDGLEALEHIKKQKPDLISLDLIMPRKSGIKLFHELQKNKEWSKIPVLIVTAHAKDEMGQSSLEEIMNSRSLSGPGIYLEKPVTPTKYVNSIKNVLGIPVDEKSKDPVSMKEEVQNQLKGADPETLAKMLEFLKKKGS